MKPVTILPPVNVRNLGLDEADEHDLFVDAKPLLTTWLRLIEAAHHRLGLYLRNPLFDAKRREAVVLTEPDARIGLVLADRLSNAAGEMASIGFPHSATHRTALAARGTEISLFSSVFDSRLTGFDLESYRRLYRRWVQPGVPPDMPTAVRVVEASPYNLRFGYAYLRHGTPRWQHILELPCQPIPNLYAAETWPHSMPCEACRT